MSKLKINQFKFDVSVICPKCGKTAEIKDVVTSDKDLNSLKINEVFKFYDNYKGKHTSTCECCNTAMVPQYILNYKLENPETDEKCFDVLNDLNFDVACGITPQN